MDWYGRVPELRSRRDSETRLQTLEARLEQRRHQGRHGTVALMPGQELRPPLDDAAAALRLHFEDAGVL